MPPLDQNFNCFGIGAILISSGFLKRNHVNFSQN